MHASASFKEDPFLRPSSEMVRFWSIFGLRYCEILVTSILASIYLHLVLPYRHVFASRASPPALADAGLGQRLEPDRRRLFGCLRGRVWGLGLRLHSLGHEFRVTG